VRNAVLCIRETLCGSRAHNTFFNFNFLINCAVHVRQSVRPSDRLSVCLSVSLVHYVETAVEIYQETLSSGSRERRVTLNGASSTDRV